MNLDLFPELEVDRLDRLRAELEAARAQRLYDAQTDTDLTPPDVARLGAHALRVVCGIMPRRILGPCAGSGTWLEAAREVWGAPIGSNGRLYPGAEIGGMDIRAEELPHLQHHVGELAKIGDFLSEDPPIAVPDLILDNLPFKYALEFLQRGLDIVAAGGHVAWFCRMTLGDADAVNKWLERNPPQHVLEFVDRFKFRVGINPETGKKWGVDSTGYKLLVFRSGSKPYVYLGKRLPSLPLESRRWRKTKAGIDIRPGTEYLHGDDVEPRAEIRL